MGSGIDNQRFNQQKMYYSQTAGVAAQQQQTQKATTMTKSSSNKSESTKTSDSGKDSKNSVSSEGIDGGEDGKESALAIMGGEIGGSTKTQSKEKKSGVDRRRVSEDETNLSEDSDISETEETSTNTSINNINSGVSKKLSEEFTVKNISVRTRHKEKNNLIDFIEEWLKIKRSPLFNRGLGEIMVEEGADNKIDPLLLLAIGANESNYGKNNMDVKGFMGLELGPDPEEQIIEAAILFNDLRKKGEAVPGDNVAKQLIAVNRAGWTENINWNRAVFRYYQEIKRAWERYSELK